MSTIKEKLRLNSCIFLYVAFRRNILISIFKFFTKSKSSVNNLHIALVFLQKTGVFFCHYQKADKNADKILILHPLSKMRYFSYFKYN